MEKKRAMDLTEKKSATTNRQQAKQLRLALQKMVQPSGTTLLDCSGAETQPQQPHASVISSGDQIVLPYGHACHGAGS